MENKTKNYKFPKPGEDDFYDINEYNRTLDSIDEELMNLEQKKLDTTGDSSQTVTAFAEEVLRENLESGETLSLSHGKIKKWFSEMKDIAFSGRASDIETDGANRFVTDGEKRNWNSKVSADGNISDTRIQSLDSVSAEFPVPEEGESSRQFFGKVRKFIQDFNNFKTGIITVGKLVNNGSTTAGGYALDARYGKTLFDLYNNLNGNLDNLNSNLGDKADLNNINAFLGTQYVTASPHVDTNSWINAHLVARAPHHIDSSSRAMYGFENMGLCALALYLDGDGRLKTKSINGSENTLALNSDLNNKANKSEVLAFKPLPSVYTDSISEAGIYTAVVTADTNTTAYYPVVGNIGDSWTFIAFAKGINKPPILAYQNNFPSRFYSGFRNANYGYSWKSLLS